MKPKLLFALSTLLIFANAGSVTAQKTPDQNAQAATNLQNAEKRQKLVEEVLASLSGERKDIRGFYLGMTRDQFSAQAARLQLNTCFFEKSVNENGPELSWFVYKCPTFSDLEKRERYRWSEEYEVMFSKGLKPNVLTSFKFRFISALPQEDIVSEISKQYGVKPSHDVNAVVPIGQLGFLPMGREATFQLKDGVLLKFARAFGREKFFHEMELEWPGLEQKIKADKEAQDRNLSPRTRF
jgi:hypothetical protein